jgi:hypothetical protein
MNQPPRATASASVDAMTNVQRRARFRLPLLASCLALAVASTLAACGGSGDDVESFDNLPDCVADHADLGEPEGIAHCLVDFPDIHPDFADQAECEAWVSDAANGGYANSATEACTTYFTETGA